MNQKHYDSYDEIHTSYREISQTMETVLAQSQAVREFFRQERELVFIACGSSYWMSMSAAMTLRLRTGCKATAIKAGEIVLAPGDYRNLFERPVIITPSRSGSTSEVLEAVRIFKEFYPGAKVFSITEYENTKLAAISDYNVSIPWANEISVCQTRSFNCLWTCFITIAAILADDGKLLSDLKDYLSRAPGLYAKGERLVHQILGDMGGVSLALTLGSGRQYGVVIESAYIITEMAELASNYYHLMEYRHGPVVTAGEHVLIGVCNASERTLPYEEKMSQEARERGGKVVAVTRRPVDWADYNLSLDRDYEPEIVSLFFVFLHQSLAHYISLERGRNPDEPGNLVRFITL